MNELFLKIVNMSISASWLVLAVLALRLILKRSPKWVNVVLWSIVALRLVVPFSIESALSLIPSAETIPTNIEMVETPAIDSGINAINGVVNPVISQSNTPAVGANANPLQITIGILATSWAIGVVVLLAYTAISYWRLRQKVSEATLLRDNIYQCERVASPFVLGIIKPRIYLSYQIDGQDLQHVVAHEQAHIRRKDHWWKPLGFLLLTVHWFNPLMWLAYVLLCRDIELACDEKVIKELGNAQRADYSQALLACSVNRRMIAACPLAFGEVGVKERVKSVMNYRKPAFWVVVVSVVACVVVAVCFLTNPVSSQILPQKLAEHACVEVDIQDISLSEFDEMELLTITDEEEIDQLISAIEQTTFKKTFRRFHEAPDNLAGVVQLLEEVTDPEKNPTIFSLIFLSQGDDYAIYTTIRDANGEDHHLVADQPAELIKHITTLAKTKREDKTESSYDSTAHNPAVQWVYSPMMSASWHGFFLFDFDLDKEYSHIEASCDNGTLHDLRIHPVYGQQDGKNLRFESGDPVYWSPVIGDDLGDTAENATVSFTVYNGEEALYSGTLNITRTGTEDGRSFYEATLSGTDLLAVQQSPNSASVIHSEYASNPPENVLRENISPQVVDVFPFSVEGDFELHTVSEDYFLNEGDTITIAGTWGDPYDIQVRLVQKDNGNSLSGSIGIYDACTFVVPETGSYVLQVACHHNVSGMIEWSVSVSNDLLRP